MMIKGQMKVVACVLESEIQGSLHHL